ncbi:unnamed protein product [Mytilus coruscus]|uniref:C2H2-type domain-containing protein n=1 Tax=Mytilus coruscus TaxID=42192 RepID=A0A6J8AIR4_MYTCO|nr:unnamed protein product [Mytilus coruscus]
MKKTCKKQTNSNSNTKFTCKHCGVPFDTYELLFKHAIDNHPLNGQQGGEARNENDFAIHNQAPTVDTSNKNNRYVRKGALGDNVYQTTIIPEKGEKYDILGFFTETKNEVDNELVMRRDKIRDIKWYLNVRVEMERNIDGGRKEKVAPYFRSKTYTALANDENDHNLNEAFQKMNASLEEFIHKGSDWVVKKIISLEVNTVKYSPIAGSSYMELPTNLRFSGGLVNVKNEDHKCFLWSILAGLHPAQRNPNQVLHYRKYEHSMDLTGIDFPRFIV